MQVSSPYTVLARTMFLLAVLFASCGIVYAAVKKNPEITDPAAAAKDPDFLIQGEYLVQGHGRAATASRSAPK